MDSVVGVAGSLFSRFDDRTATVGIVGLGYVGLPLAKAVLDAGFKVIGVDVDSEKIQKLEAGQQYIKHVSAEYFIDKIAKNRFRGTTDFSTLETAQAIVICVPTPLTRHKEPELSFVVNTAESISKHLQPNQLVVLESTTYPGTTDEILVPILERSGLRCGSDFFVAFSPEREDPGNPEFDTRSIPKVIGGFDDRSLKLAMALYRQFVVDVVPVSSTSTAEAVKITENIFRAVNIALVNELKLIFGAMDIDIWEVIEAAKTKPFGYMPFYPGPGLGGHCIPIDPFYLAWKAREFDIPTRFIELAGQINSQMPAHVVSVCSAALNLRFGTGLNGSKILLVGIAYKKNVDDMRESPGLKLTELLERAGANVDYYDPHIPILPQTREHPEFAGRSSISLDDGVGAYDAILIATDHDSINYPRLVNEGRLVIDTRNACGRLGIRADHVVKA